jgi:hypothetical protein
MSVRSPHELNCEVVFRHHFPDGQHCSLNDRQRSGDAASTARGRMEAQEVKIERG